MMMTSPLGSVNCIVSETIQVEAELEVAPMKRYITAAEATRASR